MSEDNSLDEGSLIEDNFSDEPAQPLPITGSSDAPASKSKLVSFWEGVSQAGLAETTTRLGTSILLVALILIVAWAMRQYYLYAQPDQAPEEAALAAALPTPTPGEASAQLPPYPAQPVLVTGIPRSVMLHTTIPTRPRAEISKYIVEKGDTVFGIAEKFGLKPETILWGNQFVLGDNPHNLREGQELNILPVNGTYYKWQAGDGLNGVSKFFGVKPEDIINYPGNNLSPEMVGDLCSSQHRCGHLADRSWRYARICDLERSCHPAR